MELLMYLETVEVRYIQLLYNHLYPCAIVLYLYYVFAYNSDTYIIGNYKCLYLCTHVQSFFEYNYVHVHH